MTISQHKELASGRWSELSFVEQMANVGSEISRALNWQKKGNDVYCKKSIVRALELLILTINVNTSPSHFKELARVKEAIIDFFYGSNEFKSSEDLWRSYFDHFNYAARINH